MPIFKTKHIGGKFYSVEDENSVVFIGTQEKAHAYVKGEHKPQIATVFEEAPVIDLTEETEEYEDALE
jgi:hypothetical protein